MHKKNFRKKKNKQKIAKIDSINKPNALQASSSEVDKNQSCLSPIGLSVAKGLLRLILGQKQFAEEFGLSAARVFPQAEKALQDIDIENQIADWLCSDEGKPHIDKIFNDLVAHQLALISALDGIALQTLSELDLKKLSPNPLKHMLTKIGLDRHKKQSNIKENIKSLQQNQKLRHQKVVAPGFVSVYSRSRELLQ